MGLLENYQKVFPNEARHIVRLARLSWKTSKPVSILAALMCLLPPFAAGFMVGRQTGMVNVYNVSNAPVLPPAKPEEPKTSLSKLSNEQLTAAIVTYVKRVRTFDANSETEMRFATADRPITPKDYMINPESREAYMKLWIDFTNRETAVRTRMLDRKRLTFRNEYLAQGREIEAELLSRLATIGILDYGKESERIPLDSSYNGAFPLSVFADYLERNARRLPP